MSTDETLKKLLEQLEEMNSNLRWIMSRMKTPREIALEMQTLMNQTGKSRPIL